MNAQRPLTPDEISSAEIRIIRWGEKILTPLLIAGFIGIITFLIHVGNTMAQLSQEQVTINGDKKTIYETLEKLDEKIDDQRADAQQVKITIQRMDSNQQNLKEQMTDLKQQNIEIIRLLRSNINTVRD